MAHRLRGHVKSQHIWWDAPGVDFAYPFGYAHAWTIEGGLTNRNVLARQGRSRLSGRDIGGGSSHENW